MSEPSIYTIKLTGYPEDQYVLWRDYARLKAEVESMTISPASRLLRASRVEVKLLEAKVLQLTAELSNVTGWGRGLESDLSRARVIISFLNSEFERLSAFCTLTIIPNEILQADINQLNIELADARESYHIMNEIIASERNVHRTNTLMLKDQIDDLIVNNRILEERVLAYQKLKQLNDISRPPNEA